ncbi:MAG: hypothetical protein ABIP06_04025 [Pyrinomonadaceae bacterium]
MQLKICKTCKRPFLANNEFCPKCPPPYNPDSYANLGCLLLSTVVPLFLFILFWLFFFLGFFIR